MKIRIPTLLIGLLCAASSVSAADRKAYHAARCLFNINFDYGLSRSSITGVTAIGDTQVNCPLIRDRLETSNSLNNVEVEGYNNGGDYWCGLFSQTEDGSSGGQLDYDSFHVTTTGRLSRSLSVDSTSGTTGGNEGTYTVACILPSGSSVYHIYVSEDDVAGVD